MMTTYICCWWNELKACEIIAFTGWKDLLLSSSLQQFPLWEVVYHCCSLVQSPVLNVALRPCGPPHFGDAMPYRPSGGSLHQFRLGKRAIVGCTLSTLQNHKWHTGHAAVFEVANASLWNNIHQVCLLRLRLVARNQNLNPTFPTKSFSPLWSNSREREVSWTFNRLLRELSKTPLTHSSLLENSPSLWGVTAPFCSECNHATITHFLRLEQ